MDTQHQREDRDGIYYQVFTHFQNVIVSLGRLSLTSNNKVIQNVNDIQSDVEMLCREFKLTRGSEKAELAVARLQGQFNRRCGQWKTHASNAISQARAVGTGAGGKASVMAVKPQTLEAEFHRNKSYVSSAERSFERLRTTLSRDIALKLGVDLASAEKLPTSRPQENIETHGEVLPNSKRAKELDDELAQIVGVGLPLNYEEGRSEPKNKTREAVFGRGPSIYWITQWREYRSCLILEFFIVPKHPKYFGEFSGGYKPSLSLKAFGAYGKTALDFRPVTYDLQKVSRSGGVVMKKYFERLTQQFLEIEQIPCLACSVRTELDFRTQVKVRYSLHLG